MNAANEIASVDETQPSVHIGARPVRVAAVQTPAAESVAAGLERATPLVQRAAAEAAEMVLLPELMAVHYVFTAEMWDSAEPTKCLTVEWLTASVTLEPARKTRETPRTYGSYVYPAGVASLVVLPPAWLFGRAYSLSSRRRHRARLVAGREPRSVAV